MKRWQKIWPAIILAGLAVISAAPQVAAQSLADAIEALPDKIVTNPDALPWLEAKTLPEVKANLFSHLHDEHMPSIRAWLTMRD